MSHGLDDMTVGFVVAAVLGQTPRTLEAVGILAVIAAVTGEHER